MFFDATAEEFARSTDIRIAGGHYRRGAVFADAAKKFLRSGASVLDYGCGPGRISLLLARHGFDVTGVDPSPGMIQQALEQEVPGLHLKFRVLSGNLGESEGQGYDGIVCSSVIEYAADPRDLLLRLQHSLRPGGVLLISFANSCSLWRGYARLRYRASAPHTRFQHHLWTGGSFRKLLEACNFDVASGVTYFDSPLEQWPVLTGILKSCFNGTLGFVVAHAPARASRSGVETELSR